MSSDEINFVDSPESLLKPCLEFPKPYSHEACIFGHLIGALSMYVLPFVAFIGINMNVIVIYIFLIRIHEKTRQMFYLGVLAISDALCIVSIGIFWFIPAKGVPYATNGTQGFFTYGVSEIACKIHRFINLFASSWACNMFLLVVGDRCLSIYLPFQYSRLGLGLAKKLVLSVFIFSFLVTIPTPFIIGHFVPENSSLTFCWLTKPSRFWQGWTTAFSNAGLIPSFMIFAINFMLFAKLMQIHKIRKRLHADDNSAKNYAEEVGPTIVVLLLSSVFLVSIGPNYHVIVLLSAIHYLGKTHKMLNCFCD